MRFFNSLLIGLLCWLMVVPAWAVIAIDQSTAQETLALVATTDTMSFTSLPAVGSFVVGCVIGGDFSGDDIDFISSITDNQGNGTYTLIKKAPPSGGKASSAIFYKENVASSGTFTLTFTATNDTLIGISWRGLSFTGVALASPADQSQTGGVDGASTSLSITTGSTQQADELVIACGALLGDGTDVDLNITQNTAGYTNFIIHENNVTFPGAIGDYKIVAGIGTQNTNWSYDTVSASGSSAGVIATFKGVSTCTSGLMMMGVGGC